MGGYRWERNGTRIVGYACQDSGSIVVTDDDVKCVGDVMKIDER